MAACLGDDARALEHLRAAQDGYRDRALDFDAALVSLDLVEVHLRQGDTAEVKRLAKPIAHTFADRGVDQEARRAVAIFYRAACAEALTHEIIARTRSALLRVAYRPGNRPA